MRKWKKGDSYKGKKNFIAGLRFVFFALQLAERGRIHDFQVRRSCLRCVCELL